jgi:hypothetical protein
VEIIPGFWAYFTGRDFFVDPLMPVKLAMCELKFLQTPGSKRFLTAFGTDTLPN